MTSQRIPVSSRYSDQNRLMHHLSSTKRYNKGFFSVRRREDRKERSCQGAFFFFFPNAYCQLLISITDQVSHLASIFFLKHFCVPPLVTHNKVCSTRRRGPCESNQRMRAYGPVIQPQGLNKGSIFIKSVFPIPGSHHLSIPSSQEATKAVCTPSVI